MSEDFKETVKIKLCDYEGMKSKIETLKTQNEELRKGKKILVTRDVNIKSGVIVDNYSSLSSYGANVDCKYLGFSDNSLDRCDFDYISKDSHNEIVSKYQEEITKHSEDITVKYRKINYSDINRIKELEGQNYHLKVFSVSLALALGILIGFTI